MPYWKNKGKMYCDVLFRLPKVLLCLWLKESDCQMGDVWLTLFRACDLRKAFPPTSSKFPWTLCKIKTTQKLATRHADIHGSCGKPSGSPGALSLQFQGDTLSVTATDLTEQHQGSSCISIWEKGGLMLAVPRGNCMVSFDRCMSSEQGIIKCSLDMENC